MISQTDFTDFIGPGSLIVAVFVATISGFFALKGKRLDAGQWITNTLQNDAEVNRLEVKEMKAEIEQLKKSSGKQITLLQEAVASLLVKEKELVAYINLLEREVNVLKELLILQGAATPNISFTFENVDIPEDIGLEELEKIVFDRKEKDSND